MDRRDFVKAAALILPAAKVRALDVAGVAFEGSGNPPVLASGNLAARYQLTLDRVLHGNAPAYTPDFLLADVKPEPVRRFSEYSGDLSGRYIGALATAARVFGQSFAGLESLVTRVIALQKPDGYFGSGFHYDHPTDNDLALLWGNGRLLVGLLEYYALKPDPAVLDACRRLGDWLVRIGSLMLSTEIRAAFGAQHFASSYICWMQQTEGLANLYAVTKDERYRRLAEQVAAVIELRPGDHVHGGLTSLRGVMDLHAATGEPGLLAQCEAAWQQVAASRDALITGGVPEGWSPNNHRTEGCAEADWVRLNLALWRATGKRAYLDAAERAVFNELAFNQFATGDFGHRVYTDTGLPQQGAARAWWCCTLHGLRAFPDVHENVFRATDEGLWFDLPLDARVATERLAAVSESTLGDDGTVRITVTASRGGVAAIFIRRPQWASGVAIQAAGGARPGPVGDGYVRVERAWAAGDVVEVKYEMGLRPVHRDGDRMVYFYGPWLLGASAADNPAVFNELTAENRVVRGSERPSAAAGQRRRFSVPIAATAAKCIPAEFPDQPQTLELRTIAEQTGQTPTGWELGFLGGEKG